MPDSIASKLVKNDLILEIYKIFAGFSGALPINGLKIEATLLRKKATIELAHDETFRVLTRTRGYVLYSPADGTFQPVLRWSCPPIYFLLRSELWSNFNLWFNTFFASRNWKLCLD